MHPPPPPPGYPWHPGGSGPYYPPNYAPPPGWYPPPVAQPGVWGVRLLAALLDAALFCGVSFGIALVAAELRDALGLGRYSDELGVAVLVVVAVLFWVQFVWAVARFGRTPGKTLLLLKVVDPVTGLPPGQLRALGRSLFFSLMFWIVPFGLFVDNLWPLWDRPHRQALHDKVVNVAVVRTGLPWR